MLLHRPSLCEISPDWVRSSQSIEEEESRPPTGKREEDARGGAESSSSNDASSDIVARPNDTGLGAGWMRGGRDALWLRYLFPRFDDVETNTWVLVRARAIQYVGEFFFWLDFGATILF